MNTHTNTYIKSVESPITVSVLEISKFTRLKCLYNKYWQGKNFKWNSDCLCTSAWMAWTFVCWQASNFIFENIDIEVSPCVVLGRSSHTLVLIMRHFQNCSVERKLFYPFLWFTYLRLYGFYIKRNKSKIIFAGIPCFALNICISRIWRFFLRIVMLL